MRFRMLLAGVLLAGLGVSSAHADQWCSLSVAPTSVVGVGQSFSYVVTIQGQPWPSPTPPGGNPGPPFTLVFHGSKNGEQDIPASGEAYPGDFGYGQSVLGGFVNPGLNAFYVRSVTVFAQNHPGYVYCTTNEVALYLQ